MSRLMAMYSSVLTSALISSAPSRDLRLVGISTTPHRSVSSCWLGGLVFHVSKFFSCAYVSYRPTGCAVVVYE